MLVEKLNHQKKQTLSNISDFTFAMFIVIFTTCFTKKRKLKSSRNT